MTTMNPTTQPLVHDEVERHHDPLVSHQFEDAVQQKESATLGMWAFLATEVLFFGALFVSYGIYRFKFPHAFLHGSIDLSWYLGAINTGVLLFSSFFMAMAVRSATLGLNKSVIIWLILTIVMALAFLGVKSREYYTEYKEGLVPYGSLWTDHVPEEPATGSEEQKKVAAEARPREEKIFMSFYFIMTAIHATHMIVGIGVMIGIIIMTQRGKFSAAYHNPVEMTGLYWHFVDVVWVFLFPLLYLLRNP